MSYTSVSPPERGSIVVPSEMEIGETYLEVFEHDSLEGYDVTVGVMKERGFVPRSKFQVSGRGIKNPKSNTFFEIATPGYPGVRDPVEQETLTESTTISYHEPREQPIPGFEIASTEDMVKALHLTDEITGEVKSILERNGYRPE